MNQIRFQQILKNAFDIERFLSTKLKLRPEDVYEIYEFDE